MLGCCCEVAHTNHMPFIPGNTLGWLLAFDKQNFLTKVAEIVECVCVLVVYADELRVLARSTYTNLIIFRTITRTQFPESRQGLGGLGPDIGFHTAEIRVSVKVFRADRNPSRCRQGALHAALSSQELVICRAGARPKLVNLDALPSSSLEPLATWSNGRAWHCHGRSS